MDPTGFALLSLWVVLSPLLPAYGTAAWIPLSVPGGHFRQQGTARYFAEKRHAFTFVAGYEMARACSKGNTKNLLEDHTPSSIPLFVASALGIA